MEAIASAGFHVVAPMMRGYEPGSQPVDQDYSFEAIISDVLAWADQLGVQKFHVVGHDWGAAIAYIAGAMVPERIDSITAMAVPHGARFGPALVKVPGQAVKSWYMNFFQLRGLAEWTVKRNDWALIRKLWRDWSPGYELSHAEWDNLRATFEAKGVLKAMLAYYRRNATLSALLGFKPTAMTQMTKVGVPTLAITGENDGCIDTRMFDHTFLPENFTKGFEIERVSGVGHFLHREAPDRINPLIINWLNTHAQREA